MSTIGAILKYMVFQQLHKYRAPGIILNALVWAFFILATVGQIYFNLLPFEQAVENTSQATSVEFDQFFNTETNIFYNDNLIWLFKELFDVIFVTSAIVAFVGTWVLSQGRSLWEAFLLFLTLALPRTRREWGLVADEETGEPVEFAVIRLYATDGKKFISQTVSDLDGRYRIFLPEVYNNFIIEVNAQGHTPIELKAYRKEGETGYHYDKEIRLQKLGSDSSLGRLSAGQFKAKVKVPTTYLVFALSTIVTLHSTYGMLAIPQVDTYIFFFWYGLAWIWNVKVILDSRHKVRGRVISAVDKKPVAGVFMNLYSLDKQLLETQVTGSGGLANFKVEEGSYLLQMSRRGLVTPDMVEVRVDTKGYLGSDLEVKLGSEAETESVPSPFG